MRTVSESKPRDFSGESLCSRSEPDAPLALNEAAIGGLVVEEWLESVPRLPGKGLEDAEIGQR